MYKVVLTSEAQKDMIRLDGSLQTRLLDKIEWLGQNCLSIQHQPLQGNQWLGCYKYRLGEYRIVYEYDQPIGTVVILKVGHLRGKDFRTMPI